MGKKSRKKEDLKKENNMNNEEMNEIKEETTEEVIESVTEVDESQNEVTEEAQEVEETIEEVDESQNEVVEENANNKTGKIFGFEKLYVRKDPSVDSEPVGIVTVDDDLAIDEYHSTDDFYKVYTSNGLEGYCVKKFVRID